MKTQIVFTILLGALAIAMVAHAEQAGSAGQSAFSQKTFVSAKENELGVYRGYIYKILTSQGPNASGGERGYLVGGRMTKGFALVAFPARYGVSGLFTFLVNQDGIVFRRISDLKQASWGRR